MTSSVEPLLPTLRPTLLDRWSARLVGDARIARLWRWLAPTLVTLVAFGLRVWNLGNPHALVFDETYYVKDAWSQWNLGYASTWPDGANDRFLAGETDIFTTRGSFVVHPPLGKLFIGLGMFLFGPESSAGWRIAAAVFGTATVLVLYLAARTMTGSIAFATVASGLMAIDGLAIVMSRVSVLDIFLAFFVLLTFWFVLLDRRTHLVRLEDAIDARVAAGAGSAPDWGPLLWNRPWLIAAGAAVGAATAVKWSGLYVAAGFGLYLVVTDALARRRAGVLFWPMDAVRQGLVAFVLFVPVAVVVYVGSWLGWILTDDGYGRHAIDDGSWWQNLWKYHEAMYGFHVGLSSPHGYASPAWQWPLLIRPTSMYYQQGTYGEGGCELAGGCVQNIYSMPNPLIWYGSVAAAIYLMWRFAVRRDGRDAAILVGIAVTYVPWLLYPERTIFQFYTIAILPFLLLALTTALRDIARGRRPTGDPLLDDYRRRTGQRLVWVFLGVALLLSAYWYPILTATTVPYDFWRLHNWMPTWI